MNAGEVLAAVQLMGHGIVDVVDARGRSRRCVPRTLTRAANGWHPAVC